MWLMFWNLNFSWYQKQVWHLWVRLILISMGLLDKFKSKKKESTDKKRESAVGKRMKGKKKEAVSEEVKQETVVTPDGKMMSVPKKVSSQSKKKVKPKKEDTGEAYRVLLRPCITEKGSSLGVYNQYVFEVAPRTNKIEVRKAIKKVYGVDPIKVNMMAVSGKGVRYGRTEGRTKSWKKAIITLSEGQKIDIQEGL